MGGGSNPTRTTNLLESFCGFSDLLSGDCFTHLSLTTPCPQWNTANLNDLENTKEKFALPRTNSFQT